MASVGDLKKIKPGTYINPISGGYCQVANCELVKITTIREDGKLIVTSFSLGQIIVTEADLIDA